ncbi:HD domain-containing protein [Chloroflexus sp.]|uniref:HD domain-containing protein n=1 Tax=Chloroflexus sp. TaxID=1904827 RepID=UPI002ACDA198|nr:HD domain-containing protein [Chloroflexus sp.]
MLMLTDSSDLVQTALYFAARAHNGQQRPGSDLPYFVHLSDVTLEVAATLAVEPGHDHTLALCCALLHDVLEDTTIEEATLAARFGPAVAAGVRALTKDPTLPAAERIPDSLRRIQQQPREVWLVKLADRISNLSVPPPAHWSPERVAGYRTEGELILNTLGIASPRLAARLRAKIEQYGVQ